MWVATYEMPLVFFERESQGLLGSNVGTLHLNVPAPIVVSVGDTNHLQTFLRKPTF